MCWSFNSNLIQGKRGKKPCFHFHTKNVLQWGTAFTRGVVPGLEWLCTPDDLPRLRQSLPRPRRLQRRLQMPRLPHLPKSPPPRRSRCISAGGVSQSRHDITSKSSRMFMARKSEHHESRTIFASFGGLLDLDVDEKPPAATYLCVMQQDYAYFKAVRNRRPAHPLDPYV